MMLTKDNREENFFKTVCALAIPVALQSMLQSSFSIVDQMMVGQLGSTSIAAIGIAGKFSSIFSVVVSAVGAVAGIMISQYIGSNDRDEADKSLRLNLMVAISIAGIFFLISILIPSQLTGLYSKDETTVKMAAGYLRLIAFSFVPIAVTTCVSTMLRCIGKAFIPLYASIVAALVNTGLNYGFIFGKLFFPKCGVRGAAIATAVAGGVNLVFTLIGFIVVDYGRNYSKRLVTFSFRLGKMTGKKYLTILMPLLANEFLWSLGENVYASIYGHLGTEDYAAMTLTFPVQGLMIGALSGISQAAGILIGKELGKADYDEAYRKSKRLMFYGLFGSVILSVVLIYLRKFYVDIYHVNEGVKQVGVQILLIFAIISPVKVMNMVVGAGILRSGGKTRSIMYIEVIGTWLFGVPLGVISAFVLKLSIPYVYLLLSMEECVRLLLELVVFKKKRWMQKID